MAKKMRNGLTQKQRKTQNKRVAQGIDIYIIRPSRPMRPNWKNYPDPADESPVVNTDTRQTRGGRTDDAQLGLASVADVKPLAGGKGRPTSTVCQYCGEPDGHHTAQCPTVSFGGAS